MNYSDQIHLPKWQRLRLRVMERDQWLCTECGNGERELHVHHKYYIKDRPIWKYPISALLTLCDKCHKDEHHYDSRAVMRSAKNLHDEKRIEHLASLFMRYMTDPEFRELIDKKYYTSIKSAAA